MRRWSLLLLVTSVLSWLDVEALDIVKDGKAVATIVTASGKVVTSVSDSRWFGAQCNDDTAAYVLAEWIEKITDVKLPVATEQAPGHAGIYTGEAAKKQGLKLKDVLIADIDPSKASRFYAKNFKPDLYAEQ